MFTLVAICILMVSTTEAIEDFATGFDVTLQRSCYNCTDPSSCKNLVFKSKTCQKSDEICKIYFDEQGNPTKAGCINEKSPCKETECYDCFTKDCNNVNTCFKCDSEHNVNCVSLDEPSALNIVNCTNGCFVKITDKGHTQRGCLEELTEDCNNDKCAKGFLPNHHIFPANRLKCYQCNHTHPHCAEPSKQFSESFGKPCKLYTPDNECYQSYKAKQIKRGCTKDDFTFGCTDKITCQKCKTTACNDKFASNIIVNGSSGIIFLNTLIGLVCSIYVLSATIV